MKWGKNYKKQRNFFAISNETLLYPYESNGGFPTIWMKKKYIEVIQKSEKLSPFFKNIHDSFLRQLYLELTIERLKGRKHANVKFTFASHVRA